MAFAAGTGRQLWPLHHLDRERLQEAQRDVRHIEERCSAEEELYTAACADGKRRRSSYHQQRRGAVSVAPEAGGTKEVLGEEESSEEPDGHGSPQPGHLA